MLGKREPILFQGETIFGGPNAAEELRSRAKVLGVRYAPDFLIGTTGNVVEGYTSLQTEVQVSAAAQTIVQLMKQHDAEPYDQTAIDEYEAALAEHRRRETPSRLRLFARRRFMHALSNPVVISLDI
jgi:hypothetical protein